MSNPFTDQKDEEKSIDYLPLSQQRKIKQNIVAEIEKDLSGEKEIILGNIPSKSNCYRIVTIPRKAPDKSYSSLAKTGELKEYEKRFGIQCRIYRNANIQGSFMLHVDVFYPSMRADLDNSLKVLLDCLQGAGAFKNDNKCSRIVANRFLDKNNPRIEFYLAKVSEIPEP